MATPSLLFFRLRLRPSPSLRSYSLRKVQQATPFSSSPQPLWQPDPVPNLPPVPPPSSEPKAGLSARMSFIFDQIDAIERSRGAKDEALQRIRAWRQSKQLQQQERPEQEGANVNEPSRRSDLHGVMAAEVDTGTAESPQVAIREQGGNVFTREVEFVHPWPEWIELMELLVKRNYFDHRRFCEDQVAKGLSIDLSGVAEETGFDFTRDWVTVRNACLNFGRDRFDILRSLSKNDLQILVGNGCPSTDKKVVFSAKLLRKHTHLDEGDVCSACKLRSICSSGYLATKKEDEARTLDVMRVLLTFAFDSINGSVENQTLMKMKSVKIIVRKLLHEVVKLGAVPIDPNLPLPVIKRPPPKVKQPPPPPKKRIGRDDVEMKKGDWLCPKCDFMNFAKNVVCLQCDAKRPKRQLLPGEWECPQCNFLNYRRNMACFHCDHKRPPDEFTDNRMQFKPQGSQTKLERTERSNVSNAWNFDFDDNESDGADVAAFEFADPPRMSDGSLDGPPRRDVGGGGLENSYSECSYTPRICNGDRRLMNPDEKTLSHVPKTGFDDFDDEDDDVDSYEIDNQTNSQSCEGLLKNKYISENDSALDDFDDFESGHKHHGSSHGTSSAWSDDDNQSIGSDSDFSGHPQRKSSKRRSQVLVDNNTNNGMSNDHELDSDSEGNFDFELSSKQIRGAKCESHTCGSRRMRTYDSDDDHFGSESEDYGHRRLDGRNLAPNRGSRNLRNNFRESSRTDSPVTQKFQVNRGRRQRENALGHTREDRTYGGPTAKIQGARADGYFTRRGKSERRGFSDFDRSNKPKNGRFGYEQGGKPDYFDRRQQTNIYRQGKSNQRKNHPSF